MSYDLVYVCPSVASGYCIRTAELFELVYGIEAALGPLYYKGIHMSPEIRVLPSGT